MVEAGVDAVGIHLQSDARRANPKLIEDDYLGEAARAVFEQFRVCAPRVGLQVDTNRVDAGLDPPKRDFA